MITIGSKFVCEHFYFAEIVHPPVTVVAYQMLIQHSNYCTSATWLTTIKGGSQMCSFLTKHNATDNASFEGACNCHERNNKSQCIENTQMMRQKYSVKWCTQHALNYYKVLLTHTSYHRIRSKVENVEKQKQSTKYHAVKEWTYWLNKVE